MKKFFVYAMSNLMTVRLLAFTVAVQVGMTSTAEAMIGAHLQPPVSSFATFVACTLGQPCNAPGPFGGGPTPAPGGGRACQRCKYPTGFLPNPTRPGQSCVIKKVICLCGPQHVKSYQPMCLYPAFLPRPGL